MKPVIYVENVAESDLADSAINILKKQSLPQSKTCSESFVLLEFENQFDRLL
jgi:hypothetical protein